MSETPTPPLRRFLDPAALPLLVGGLVLVLAAAWLWLTPRPARVPHPAAVALAEMEGRVAALEALQARLAALEARPAPDLAPLDRRIAALEGRPPPDLSGLERRIETLPPPPDLQPLDARIAAADARLAAAEARLAEVAARPVLDPAALAPRAAVETLTTRADRLSERLDAVAARQQAGDTEAIRRNEDLARSMGERLAAADRAQTERIGAAGTALEQRLRGAESALVARIAALEQAQARVAALEARATRLAAFDALRLRLEAGLPLGPALAALPDAQPALTRFVASAPPTEAALRLSFEPAARAAAAASEPSQSGQGVLQGAASRLSGLVTVRRGEDVVWGDAAAGEIERARRALAAGDIEAALARLERLPPAARAAIAEWTAEARALLEARAALAALTAG
jgi:hypothetical protein